MSLPKQRNLLNQHHERKAIGRSRLRKKTPLSSCPRLNARRRHIKSSNQLRPRRTRTKIYPSLDTTLPHFCRLAAAVRVPIRFSGPRSCISILKDVFTSYKLISYPKLAQLPSQTSRKFDPSFLNSKVARPSNQIQPFHVEIDSRSPSSWLLDHPSI